LSSNILRESIPNASTEEITEALKPTIIFLIHNNLVESRLSSWPIDEITILIDISSYSYIDFKR